MQDNVRQFDEEFNRDVGGLQRVGGYEGQQVHLQHRYGNMETASEETQYGYIRDAAQHIWRFWYNHDDIYSL